MITIGRIQMKTRFQGAAANPCNSQFTQYASGHASALRNAATPAFQGAFGNKNPYTPAAIGIPVSKVPVADAAATRNTITKSSRVSLFTPPTRLHPKKLPELSTKPNVVSR